MEKKYNLLTILCAVICFSSCSDYLSVERYFNDRQDLERIFKSRDYTEEWLANGYYQLLSSNLDIGHVKFTVSNFSDDMTFNEDPSFNGNSISFQDFKAGSYDIDRLNGSWTQSYKGIRQASILIENVDINEDFTKEEIDDIKGQAYFLRGYLYWLLIRKYGPVPILPDQALDYDASYDELSYPRNSYDECVEYIAEQMLLAASLMKPDRDARSAGRPTVGSALAVRAKAYLYAASPLFNGNPEMADFVDHEGRILISQEYDHSKWARAAAAALDVIELGKYKLFVSAARKTGSEAYPATITPPYHPVYSEANWPDGWADIDPMESYRALFNGDLYVNENPELIFTRGG